jgi:hypothetical protein
MDQCSHPARHPTGRLALLTDQGRHDLDVGLKGLPELVLDPWRIGPNPSTTPGRFDSH